MEPKRSLDMNLRVIDIPDEKLSAIKSAAVFFHEKVDAILKDVELTDGTYYSFSITDSELIDPEFGVGEPAYHNYRRRRA